MRIITIEEYLVYIHTNPETANMLPACEIMKTYHKPLDGNNIIHMSEVLRLSKFPNSFIDVILKYEFNALRLGNVTFGEIPNAYAYKLQWLIDLNKRFMVRQPMAFKNLKANDWIIVAEYEKEVITLDLIDGGIYVLLEELNLKAQRKIANNFTDFMSYLVTGVMLRATKNTHVIADMIAPEYREESLFFWQSAFPAIN